MSSMIFQPLLHDPLGWKPSNSTYVDHYKWKKYRATSKDKKNSSYGQQIQRKLQKQQSNQCLPLTTNGEQTIDRVIVVKKNEDQQEPPITYRYSPSKTPVYIVEYNQRPISANGSTISNSKASQRPPTAPAAIEEKTRPVTAFDNRQSSKVEKEKSLVDANNDNSRHWLTYPNPRTPQYIIDIKQRLGQLRVPSTLARPLSATVQQQTPQQIARPLSASIQRQQKQQTNDDQHNFLTYQPRETPEDLRATRYRIDKHRYNRSLDSYPPRPQTCPGRTTENPKPVTPQDSGNEQFSRQSSKTDAWIINEEKKTPVPDMDSSSILIQMVDCDGLPNEYVDALETANIAQEEYQRNLKMNGERRPESHIYALSDNKSDSFIAYQNQQQLPEMNHQLRQVAQSAQNDFGVWVRNATDKERASAMKLLQDVLNQPTIGYENRPKKNIFKQPPAPPPVRAASATRKLGRTRTQHQFPCEICEKLLIKRHVWDLTGSETVTCPLHSQSIQVRS